MKIGRIVIEAIRPSTPAGHPAKGEAGRPTEVTADIYRDGHDVLAARVRWKKKGSRSWQSTPMVHQVNDRWAAEITCHDLGHHEFVIEAWTDHFATWARDLRIKHEAGQDVSTELEEGALLLEKNPSTRVGPTDEIAVAAGKLRAKDLSTRDRIAAALDPALAVAAGSTPLQTDLTRSKAMPLWIDRERALVGAWYEMFPRSEGGLLGSINRLPAIAEMGFDIVYLAPIHPIGVTYRKGRNNTLNPKKDDPGSPWAIGSEAGGHTAIEPDLGTIDDFDRFVKEAEKLGLEVALDYALQCSPDHPWVKEHPDWFHHRPDGTIKYAENPPKKYQDIYPINFWPETGHESLWNACKEVLDFWISHDVKIFRVDNPHTKPFVFWEWLIDSVRNAHPDVIFLSEAFTRPKVMAKLAEIGLTQSYTYFTWRRSRWELTEYLTEIALGPTADYMRPNFWPNTPDILSEPLRGAHPGVFKQRLVLAATMSPSFGIYSGYELAENQPASDANEEYLHSEKYEIRKRDWKSAASLAPWITRLNDIRKRHPAFAELKNILFHHSTNDQIIVYSKQTRDRTDVMLMVVNLDPNSVHESSLWLDLESLGLSPGEVFEAHDEMTDTTYVWTGPDPYVRLDPSEPAHVLHLRPRSAKRKESIGILPGVH